MSGKDSPGDINSPGGSVVVDTCPCNTRKKTISVTCINQNCNYKRWHATCAGFQKPRQASLSQIGNWMCPVCVVKALPNNNSMKCTPDMFNTLYEKFENLKTEMQGKLQKMETTIANKIELQETNVNNKIKNYADTVSQNIVQHTKTNQEINKNVVELKSGIKAKFDEEQEIKEKTTKENNVLFFNVPESNKVDGKDAFADDVKKLHSILDAHVTLEKEEIKAIYRIGPKDNKRPRPIIMKLTKKEKRNDLLKLRGLEYNENVKDIEAIDDNDNEEIDGNDEINEDKEITENRQMETNTIKIFISPDRTKTEQEQHRRLVAKLKERKNNGEKNLHIKNGKIVKYQPFRGDAQLYWAEQ